MFFCFSGGAAARAAAINDSFVAGAACEHKTDKARYGRVSWGMKAGQNKFTRKGHHPAFVGRATCVNRRFYSTVLATVL